MKIELSKEKEKWMEIMKEKVVRGELRREEIECIPIRVYEGYCGEYVLCDDKHFIECNYEIVPTVEWKKHKHAEDIMVYLHENPDWKVHRLQEVLERLYEEEVK